MVVVKRLVTGSGMLRVGRLCMAKQTGPIPVRRNVPVAMWPVERVRMVRTVCGRSPRTIAAAAIVPMISEPCIITCVWNSFVVVGRFRRTGRGV